MRTLVALSTVAAAALACSVAEAQPTDPAGAEALFQEGKAAMSRKDLETACRRFAESERLDPAPGTTYFLADCEEQRGRIATAWSLFTDLGAKLPASDPKRAGILERAAALAGRLPKVTLRLAAGAPADASVTRAGAPVATGVAVPIDPGRHVFVVEAKGYARAEKAIEIAERGSLEITLPVGAKAPGTGGAISGVQAPVGIAIGSAGVGAVIAGIAVGVAAKVEYDTSDEFCEADRCFDDGLTIRESAREKGTIATIVFFVGVGAAATGVVVWLTAPKAEGGLLGSSSVRVGLTPGELVVRATW